MNATHYNEVFPLIKENQLWLGNGFSHGNAYFSVAEGALREYATGVFDAVTGLVKFRNVCWFTNLEHGRRHQPLQLMTEADNIKYSKHKEVRGIGYRKYDNYDAIEVPFTDAIPSDYAGVMGVPISFLDKFCPEQFEIVALGTGADAKRAGVKPNYRGRTDVALTDTDGRKCCPFQRILIRHRKQVRKGKAK